MNKLYASIAVITCTALTACAPRTQYYPVYIDRPAASAAPGVVERSGVNDEPRRDEGRGEQGYRDQSEGGYSATQPSDAYAQSDAGPTPNLADRPESYRPPESIANAPADTDYIDIPEDNTLPSTNGVYNYVYYPAEQVYYEPETQVYVYAEGGRWYHRTYLAPERARLLTQYVIVRMHSQRPEDYCRRVVDVCPPTYVPRRRHDDHPNDNRHWEQNRDGGQRGNNADRDRWENGRERGSNAHSDNNNNSGRDPRERGQVEHETQRRQREEPGTVVPAAVQTVVPGRDRERGRGREANGGSTNLGQQQTEHPRDGHSKITPVATSLATPIATPAPTVQPRGSERQQPEQRQRREQRAWQPTAPDTANRALQPIVIRPTPEVHFPAQPAETPQANAVQNAGREEAHRDQPREERHADRHDDGRGNAERGGGGDAPIVTGHQPTASEPSGPRNGSSGTRNVQNDQVDLPHQDRGGRNSARGESADLRNQNAQHVERSDNASNDNRGNQDQARRGEQRTQGHQDAPARVTLEQAKPSATANNAHADAKPSGEPASSQQQAHGKQDATQQTSPNADTHDKHKK